MRRYMFAAAGVAALLATAADAGPDICGCWTPQKAQIASVEKQLRSSYQLRGKLEDYARYYAGGMNGDVKFIRGQLVPLSPGEVSGIHVVTGHKMTPLQGQGCISGYDVKFARLLYISCASPGAWTPTDAQIADLERMVILPATVVPPNQYTRYYAGVTNAGRKLIQASYLHTDEPAGISVGSEAELPILGEGGCAVISFFYDPATQQTLNASCADGG